MTSGGDRPEVYYNPPCPSRGAKVSSRPSPGFPRPQVSPRFPPSPGFPVPKFPRTLDRVNRSVQTPESVENHCGDRECNTPYNGQMIERRVRKGRIGIWNGLPKIVAWNDIKPDGPHDDNEESERQEKVAFHRRRHPIRADLEAQNSTRRRPPT
jgi:hypothetical protein